ncbi:MAG: LysR family transcriptional regulator [Gammaproteobacteria bacterium]
MDRLFALRCFATVAELGGFSAAARRLGRSKASISRQVAELEASLDAQLLLRTTRRVSLTETGAVCLAQARELLASLDELENSVRGRESALGGVLRVAGPQTFAEVHLAPALEVFMRAHPALTVELSLTDGYVDLVQDACDVAIRIGTLADSSLVARRLATSRILCCVAPAYLARHGAPATPADLAAHALVVDTNFRQRSSWRFRVDGRSELVRVRGRLQVNSAVFVRAQLVAGAGIGLVPEFIGTDALAAGELVTLPFTCEPPTIGIHVVYPRRRHLAQRVRVFVDFLAAWFAGGGADGGRAATGETD